jgi:hypothetical protein
MAAFDFPAAPAPGDEYTANGITFTWTGSAWVINRFPALPLPAPTMQQKRTSVNNNPPSGLLPGQLAVEMGTPLRLWVGVPTGLDPSGKKLLTDSGLDPYVNVTGDTMTGDLTIQKATPSLILNKTGGGNGSTVSAMLNGVQRWVERLGDNTAEAGGNAGSDYVLQGYTDAGAALATPILRGSRATNRLAVAGNPIAANDIANKAYVDAAGANAVPFDAMAYSGMQVNGDFGIALEYGAAAQAIGTISSRYICDMFFLSNSSSVGTLNAQQVVGGSTNPGFNHTLKLTASAAYNFAVATDVLLMTHAVEGHRFQRMMWGLGANAKSLTIAFWIFATATGTASVACRNAANNRTYTAEFPVIASGVWEYKTVTIPGCPDGVWNTNNDLGMTLIFCFGAGTGGRIAQGAWTNTANFIGQNVTNFVGAINNVVQLQGLLLLPGSIAPTAAQSPGIVRTGREEAALVQRYYRKLIWGVEGYANPRCTMSHQFTAMRTVPTVTRTTVGTMTNIRGPNDHVNYVTASPVSESGMTLSAECSVAGQIAAVNFVESLSTRF